MTRAGLRAITQDEAQRLIRERVDAAAGEIAEFPEFANAHLADLSLQLSTLVMRLNFSGSVFERVDVTGSRLDGAGFERTRLADCDLSSLSAAGIYAKDAVFASCRFRDSYLRRAHFKRATFDGCDLSLADMCSAFAVEASFRKCRLDRTSFELAWLESADFSESVCEQTGFARAHMGNARLSGVDLRGCRFDEADLRHMACPLGMSVWTMRCSAGW